MRMTQPCHSGVLVTLDKVFDLMVQRSENEQKRRSSLFFQWFSCLVSKVGWELESPWKCESAFLCTCKYTTAHTCRPESTRESHPLQPGDQVKNKSLMTKKFSNKIKMTNFKCKILQIPRIMSGSRYRTSKFSPKMLSTLARRLTIRSVKPPPSYFIRQLNTSNLDQVATEELRYHLKVSLKKLTRQELITIYKNVPWINGNDKTVAPQMQTEAEWNSNVTLKPSPPHPYATGCYANRGFKAGDKIMKLDGEITDEATFESIQIKEGAHLQMHKPARLLNHDCAPNGYIDFENLEYKAMRDIEQGEQLTWDYNTSEWLIQRPFACRCGESVSGFVKLSEKKKEQLKKYASPFIRDMYDSRMRMVNSDSTITP